MAELDQVAQNFQNLAVSDKPVTAEPVAAADDEYNPDRDKYQALVDWLIAGGSYFPKLHLKYYAFDYRGIHASEDIPTEELIVKIPLNYIMTTEIAKASEIGKRILQTGCFLRSKHSYLATYLLYEREKGRNSFWFPYIHCLPEKYSNMPINFTEEEKSWLKGSFSLEKMDQRIESLKEEYEGICAKIPEFSRFSYDDFSWARHVVITRIFGIIVMGMKTEGLVPLADLLNHRRPRETKWTFDSYLNSFTITTVEPVTAGQQVFDSYGRKCNHRFFVNYGFSLEENEDNEVILRLSVDRSDSCYAEKVRLLGHDPSGTEREFQIPANTRDRKDRELLSFARFCVATDQELRRYPSPYSFMVDDILPISVRNEIEALKLVKQSALNCLAGFDCSEEEDNILLARGDLTMNIRNSILMRRGEKEVCRFFVELADNCIPLLSLKSEELAHASALYRNTPHEAYVNDVIRSLVRNN